MVLRLGFAGLVSSQLVGFMNQNPSDYGTGNFTLESGQFPNLNKTEIVQPTICDPNVAQHAGYISFKGQGGDKRYFFWLFESRSDPKSDPLVMWLTGGPGCSSQLALLGENGPCQVVDGDKADGVKSNPYSWNNKANVVWVDQPAQTGFSEGEQVHDEAGVAEDMYAFLQEFYKELPQYKSNKFFVTGESYAGHYVPAIGHRIWKGAKDGEGFGIPLAGLAIGNGLTDPEEQYKWYPQMGLDGGKEEGGSLKEGVLPEWEVTVMNLTVPKCVSSIESCNNGGSQQDCMQAMAICNMGLMTPYQLTGYNPYDMRIKCKVPPLCYDFSKETAYLNNKDVQKQIGVDKEWKSCNMAVNQGMMGDWMKNFQTQLPELLNDGIRVMVYAGDVDYICNWLGNKKWTLQLEYDGAAEFQKAVDKPYLVNGKTAGRLRTAKGFSFMQIYQAGHMVPMDQPEAASQMINDFIGGPFQEPEREILA